ncbi:hypothetical protein DMB66_54965 [Actinoplanes sp. ATCC 53533]|uniref:hypothetical protein n=1 Tax=Actinoplanes sp. ATCC 53533 TaxID=1288362 RepID=UPI000F7A3D3A|nr:hypothetical protein [Actinoplanes sp. ATCC 53533]RSM42201.1 hypothetical protein DMB66_54965 [Actinoplanes sp. ATCC 53533]
MTAHLVRRAAARLPGRPAPRLARRLQHLTGLLHQATVTKSDGHTIPDAFTADPVLTTPRR